MAISSLSAAAGLSPLVLSPVKLKAPKRESIVCTASGLGKSSLNLNHKQRFNQIERLNHTSGSRSAAVICAAALNARCSASGQGQGQTQTVERPVSVISKAPIHEKSPSLDDGGTGFPPRDDDGGGGGGGGGGNWGGGFFFFGFLAFLGFLKEKEDDKA